MQRRHFLSWLTTISALPVVGCSTSEVERSVSITQDILKGEIPDEVEARIPSSGSEVLDAFTREQLSKLLNRIIAIWKDQKVASAKEYVKYTSGYRSRAIVSFETGRITVETVVSKNSKEALQQAIIGTLLTPEDPSKVDLYSDKPVEYRGTPFLHGLVLDQDNLPIKYVWRATRHANYLIKTAYQTREQSGRRIHYVSFDMKRNHQETQQLRYQNFVRAQANRFKLQTALVNGIIEVESAFNPYAVSSAPAYGLMQIVPTTAGRDAHQLLHNRSGTPTKETLFRPDKNIEMGCAYLYILFNRYLVNVKHPLSREYCSIAAYNTGSGNVLKAFDSNRSRAFSKINSLTSSQVYSHLRKNLRYAEARNYLAKVTTAKRKY